MKPDDNDRTIYRRHTAARRHSEHRETAKRISEDRQRRTHARQRRALYTFTSFPADLDDNSAPCLACQAVTARCRTCNTCTAHAPHTHDTGDSADSERSIAQ